jgi:hypothetical protein
MARVPRHRVKSDACFLNIPYDERFEKLYLAYVVGLTAHGLVPTATLGVPRDARRLERIFKLIQECRYSVHDISRIQVDPGPPRAPRFNTPFELGLAVAWARLNPQRHAWVGCDEDAHNWNRRDKDLIAYVVQKERDGYRIKLPALGEIVELYTRDIARNCFDKVVGEV